MIGDLTPYARLAGTVTVIRVPFAVELIHSNLAPILVERSFIPLSPQWPDLPSHEKHRIYPFAVVLAGDNERVFTIGDPDLTKEGSAC
jgi:hypothetical protein